MLVDNSVRTFVTNPSQGVLPILPFEGDHLDEEQKHLSTYLTEINPSDDLVSKNKEYFKLKDLLSYSDMHTAFRNLSKQ